MGLFTKHTFTLYFNCPYCNQTLPFLAEQCKYCGEEITDDQKGLNTLVNYALTTSASFANDVGSNDPAVVIYILVSFVSLFLKWMLYDSLYYFWLGLEIFTTLVWFLPLIAILCWLRFHGRWNIIDDEYEQKKKEMWASLRLWLAAYGFHYILLFAII